MARRILGSAVLLIATLAGCDDVAKPTTRHVDPKTALRERVNALLGERTLVIREADGAAKRAVAVDGRDALVYEADARWPRKATVRLDAFRPAPAVIVAIGSAATRSAGSRRPSEFAFVATLDAGQLTLRDVSGRTLVADTATHAAIVDAWKAGERERP